MPRGWSKQQDTGTEAGASPAMAQSVIPVGLKNSCHLCGTYCRGLQGFAVVCSGINLGINNSPFGTAPSRGMPQFVVQLVGFFACWRLFQNHAAQMVPDSEPGLVCGHLTSSVPLPKLLLNSSSLSQALSFQVFIESNQCPFSLV